ncbi:MAG: hypothetical protein J0M12_04740 [Deltaproteobacteria bacterium]|nr:hypothetical protein [Deltaproteobacteria bacterium]
MNKLVLSTLAFALIAAVGCAKPEGPAERMGRSIDELSQSLKDMNKEWKDIQDENAQEERSDQVKKAPERVVPDHDPYYDTPPGTYVPEHY